MIGIENAVRCLEQAAWLLRNGHDAQQVRELLASASAMLDEQLQPPCTCDVRRGTDSSWYTSCLRHPLMGAGYVSTHRAIKRFYTTTAAATSAAERNGAG